MARLLKRWLQTILHYEHTIRKIKSQLGRSLLDLIDKHFVLSMPAIGSDKAMDATFKV